MHGKNSPAVHGQKNMVTITKKWHKATDPVAITNKQLDYINSLRTPENCPEWPFGSTHNTIRQLTKFDASEIIDALKNDKIIKFE